MISKFPSSLCSNGGSQLASQGWRVNFKWLDVLLAKANKAKSWLGVPGFEFCVHVLRAKPALLTVKLMVPLSEQIA